MRTEQDRDEQCMRDALAEAGKAAEAGEVPVACVIVLGEKVIARAHNLRETLQDPTAHAEILALRRAAAEVGGWRLEGAAVYCNLEPCCMCAGALVNARVQRLVYGLADPKSGGCGSVVNIPGDGRLNHVVEVRGGALAEESLQLMKEFFEPRR